MARLRHPNIVSLYKVIDTGTTVVLLLELITGGELFHWTPSGEAEAAHVVRKYITINKSILRILSIYYIFFPRCAKF